MVPMSKISMTKKVKEHFDSFGIQYIPQEVLRWLAWLIQIVFFMDRFYYHFMILIK